MHIYGWTRLRYYAKNKKNLASLMIQVHLNSINNAYMIKFRVWIPQDHEENIYFNRKNGNTKWAADKRLDLNQIYELNSF